MKFDFDSGPLQKNDQEPVELEGGTGLTEQEMDALSRAQTINFLAEIFHQVRMKQGAQSKGDSIESLDLNVSEGDRERAKNAWEALQKEKPKTKTEAIDLLLKLNDNNRGCAEDMVNALEKMGTLTFGR